MANVLRRVSLFGLNWRVLSATALVGVLAIPYIPWAACNRLEDYLITLRYARNAAAGIGAVFSEGQLYQGFTSPLQFCIGYLLCLASLGEETIPSIICLRTVLICRLSKRRKNSLRLSTIFLIDIVTMIRIVIIHLFKELKVGFFSPESI